MLAIVDCNNFYCSCERVFNPALWGKPVVVLSNNDGCVIARSEEAKALGIEMGMPLFKGRTFFKQHQVHVFSSNYTLYGDLSARVMRILRDFAASVEVYSIDESFLDFSGMDYFDLHTHGVEIRRRILKEVGIPVTVGLSLTKTLAKMANRFAKKEHRVVGVHTAVTPHAIEEILRYTKVGDIWGVGPQYAKLLQQRQVLTAYDFSLLTDAWVQQQMTVAGLRTLNEVRGLACIPLELVAPAQKGICCARSFGQAQTSFIEVAEALANYTARIGEKLRLKQLSATTLSVFCHTNPYNTTDLPYWAEKSIKLQPATSATMELIKASNSVLESIFKPGYAYQKVGVFAQGLVSSAQIQPVLFDPVDHRKNDTAIRTMDALNKRFGKGTLRMAAQGTEQRWKMKQDHLSPKYTTDPDGFLGID